MYTPEQVKAMSRPEAQTAFDMMATLYYGTERWKTDFAKSSGMTYQGVQQWFTDRSQPPAWAFLLVQAWKDHEEITNHLRSFKTVLEYINDID